MKKTAFILILASLPLIFWQCASNETANSDAVKQTEIYQSYSVIYNAGEKELEATAGFRFGGANGTTLLISQPGKVVFNGESMPSANNIFMGTYYKINRQESAESVYTFVYTDCDQNEFTNKVSLTATRIAACPETINLQAAFTVEWDAPLGEGEKMYVNIGDNKHNSASAFTGVVGATSVEVPAEVLKGLSPGSGEVWLSREKSSSLKEATHLGGVMNSKYITESAAVMLAGGNTASN